jgi:organic radical activating enzyme
MVRTSQPFVVAGERLHSRVLEVVTVEQCNLSCRSCTHHSPLSPNWQVEPGRLAQLLAALGRAFRCDVVKMMGGEPLLHECLGDVVEAVRSSGVATEVHLVTNGLLLARAPADVLRSFDQISISAYPGVRLGAAAARALNAMQREPHVRVVITPMPVFQESFSRKGTADGELVQRIYDDCKVAHEWGCYTLFDSHFFKCPQAYVLRRMTQGESVDYGEVGIDVSAPGGSDSLRSALISYLNETRPMASCRHCLGTSGASFAHALTPRTKWIAWQDLPTEALLGPGSVA